MANSYTLPKNVSFARLLRRLPVSGFQWTDDINKTPCITKPNNISDDLEPPFLFASSPLKYTYIEPFEINANKQPLFAEFARLQTNINSIVEFSNKFGYLLRPTDKVNYNIYEKEILDCKSSFVLWEQIQNAENKNKSKAANITALDNLSKMIVLHSTIYDKARIPCLSFMLPHDIKTIYQSDLLNKQIIINRHDNAWIHRLTSYNQPQPYDSDIFPIQGMIQITDSLQAEAFLKNSSDILLQAKFLLAMIINLKVSFHKINPVILLNNEMVFQQTFEPSTLLAGIWLQFSQAFLGERKYKQCSLCNKWTDVTDCRSNWSKHPNCANSARVKKHKENQQKKGI
ncbi:hypothetical protein [Anaerospora hongkongensis]|uniref:hypothetical protein n=1 Tax=Anaerospora hongkongensis TaxID=244830 RepID=UPI0028997DBC|nr:hypothetical protein [Anaerospora hongkongensis]